MIIPVRPFGLTRASNVKDVDLILADKIGDQPRSLFGGGFWPVDQLARAFLLNTKTQRLLGPAAQFARVNDNGSIGIFDVL